MKSLWTILLFILTLPLFSQKENSSIRYIPNEFIIQLEPKTNSSSFFQKINNQWAESGVIFQKENRPILITNMNDLGAQYNDEEQT